MRDRIKWTLIGLGFTFGLQVIISLLFSLIASSTARNQVDVQLMIAYGLSLGAFMIGGFVIGWMSEELRVLDALLVTVIALLLVSLVYAALPNANRGQFVSGYFLSALQRGLIFTLLSLAVAAAGAYWGFHVKAPQERAIDRIALLVGLLGAVIGPFVLLAIGGTDPANPDQASLPWYVLVIVILIVLVVIGVGFLMFTRESHPEETSINPDQHKNNDELESKL
jgi:MFS family permease